MEIHVIGLGVNVPLELPSYIAEHLNNSQAVIGWARHKPIIAAHLNSDSFCQVKSLTDLKLALTKQVEKPEHTDQAKVCILASGDPLYYGIGKWLSNNKPTNCDLVFHPAVSSIQAACNKQGISLQDAEVISLHGRPLATIRRHLKQNTTLIALTDEHSNPQAIAEQCIDAGFIDAVITAHENLGYKHECTTSYTAQSLIALNHKFDALHVSVIELKQSKYLTYEFPGIPDASFVTGAEPGKGMISKREVRLCILSYMQPTNDDVIWDIGAGCGGVAIELSYWNPKVNVYAVEYHQERLGYLHENRSRFGVVKNLAIIEGKAPDSLQGLPQPNKIFIGGNDGELHNLLALAWSLLPIGGLLVASGVIEKTKLSLTAFSEKIYNAQAGEIETIEVGVKRSVFEHGELHYNTKLPVEIFKLTKTKNVAEKLLEAQ